MTTLLLLFFSFLAGSVAHGQDAISLSAHRFAQQGFGVPKLTIHGHASGSIQTQLTCDGRRFAQQADIEPGSSMEIELTGLPIGQHICIGQLNLQTTDGGTAQMPLNLTVGVLTPLTLTVAPEDLNLDAQTMRVRASRPLSHIHVDIIGADGSVIGTGETPVNNQDGADLEWSQSPGEVVKLRVTAKDVYTLPGKLELSPWSYSIPHEDIVFASGKSDIHLDEEHKLDAAWTDIQHVLAKYGQIVTVNLYIAGYTDTVGNAAQNKTLSIARARSIAAWFKQRGFSGSIHYQGFGEAVLAVSTGDEVPEAANRRAVYLLAAQKPSKSTLVPTTQWTQLQ